MRDLLQGEPASRLEVFVVADVDIASSPDVKQQACSYPLGVPIQSARFRICRADDAHDFSFINRTFHSF